MSERFIMVLFQTNRRAFWLIAGPGLILAAFALVGASVAQDELLGEEPVIAVEDTETEVAVEDGDAEMAVDEVAEPAAAIDADTMEPADTTEIAEQDSSLDLSAEPDASEMANEAGAADGKDTIASEAPISDENLPEPVNYQIPAAAKPQPLPVETAYETSPEIPVAAAPQPMPTPQTGLGTIGLSPQAPIKVTIDRAKVLRLSEPADTVIVGNPAIVDVTLQGASTLVLTAKGFGSTNLIILNAAGDPIADEVVQTLRSSDTIARIYRGSQQFSYSCTPECTATIAVGDNAEHFDAVKDQVEAWRQWASGR